MCKCFCVTCCALWIQMFQLLAQFSLQGFWALWVTGDKDRISVLSVSDFKCHSSQTSWDDHSVWYAFISEKISRKKVDYFQSGFMNSVNSALGFHFHWQIAWGEFPHCLFNNTSEYCGIISADFPTNSPLSYKIHCIKWDPNPSPSKGLSLTHVCHPLDSAVGRAADEKTSGEAAFNNIPHTHEVS